ncbi:MAG: ATP-binding protein [Nitrospiraceae bacterium]|nr:ATP-binding protein [Nitrospiraceae bacterium]
MGTVLSRAGRFAAARIVGIYAVFAALWIYLSDHALGFLVRDPEYFVRIAVIKGFLFIIVTGLLLYLLISRYMQKSRGMEEDLRELSRRIELILDSAGEGIYGLDNEGRVTFMNSAGARMLGWEKEELIGRSSHLTWHHSRADASAYPEEECGTHDLLKSGIARTVNRDTFWRKDGSSFMTEYTITPMYDNAVLSGGVVTFRDITGRIHAEEENRRLETQFRQAQKMEAVGHLAGGVAHDFNNILTAIIGYGNLLAMKLPEDGTLRGYADQILAASDRAANLTRSLLAFSRKQVIELMPVDLNEIVSGLKKMLERIIGEDIGIEVRTSDQDLVVRSDKGQIEQALINLATNARDAMPAGGTLTITTEEVRIDDGFIRMHQYGSPGRYALVSVTDTGTGMDRATMEHIFEPFFTTKEVGKGTGLGLAMVYGTIKQHEGFINVWSEPGSGSTFRIYLPLAESWAGDKEPRAETVVPHGTETILLVEDDEAVRLVTKRLLEERGYRVIEAVGGMEAVRLFRENRERPHLVLTDLIMPEMTGRDVHRALKEIDPSVRILFMSGYAADVLEQKGLRDEKLHFISKPLRPEALSRAVRELLDSPDG